MIKSILFLILLSFTANGEPQLLWKFKSAGFIYSSPVVSGSMVYFGSNDSTIYALNIADGSLKWKFRTKGEIKSKVCVDNNSLYLNGGDGTFYSVNKTTGELLWSFGSEGEKLYPLYSYADYFHSSPVMFNNMIYFGSGDTYLYAVSKDGKLLWKFKTDDVIHSTPIVYKNKLYLGSFDGHVYCLDAVSGKMIWKFKTVGQRFFPKGEVQGNLTADCGLIFAGARDYNIYAIDAEEGYCHWNKQFPKGWALALTAEDSVLYTGTSDDDLMIAIDCITGKELWRQDLNFNIFGAPVKGDSSIYFGTLKGRLYGLNMFNGSINWVFDTEGYTEGKSKYFNNKDTINKNDFYAVVKDPEGYISALNELGAIFTSPAISGDKIIFTSADGTVYCLRL